MIKKIVLLLVCGFSLFISQAMAYEQHTDNTSITLYTNGNNQYIAKISLNEGWHTYWSNPGEIGRPTQVYGDENGKVSVVNQSIPEIKTVYETMNEYIYHSAYYLLDLQDNTSQNINFSFVECSDVCKPETLSFKISEIPPLAFEDWQQIKAEAETTFPEKIEISGELENNTALVKVSMPEIKYFIPAQEGLPLEEIISTDNTYSWQIDDDINITQALIVTDNKTYLADIIYTQTSSKNSLWWAILLAFCAGIILNAMPCVFPILSLKIFSMLKHQKNEDGLKNACAYTLGVLASFWLLTSILVFLKKQGEAVGWGFQLQSPWFVAIMAVIFLLLFFMINGVGKFPALSGQKIYKIAGLNSFTTGFFAVLIASPCTGPFMGAAISYGLMCGEIQTFVVFTALAIGYALPYALIELYPQVVGRIMPKPGVWMEKFKMILSIPVLLTSVWLFYILALQLNKSNNENFGGLAWQPYDEAQIAELAEQGENIFIDFTAEWCLTCKFNEKIILNTERFKNFIEKNNVYLFKADLTDDNPEYNKALNGYGRDSIPQYIYYRNGKYEILPLFFRISTLEK